jgi:hypothetical protein
MSWALALLPTAVNAAPEKSSVAASSPAVLIFSHTTGFRHKSIETGVATVAELVRKKGMIPVASEDPAIFERGELAPYRAIIFISNTTKHADASGDWLVGVAADNFHQWLKNGGAVVGVHGASDSHFFQPWYGEMIGGYFERHPKGVRPGKVSVKDVGHSSVKGWSMTEPMMDEWYVFRNFDPKVNLIVTLDPASIGEPAGDPWPVSWSKTYEGARIFYTSMGHSYESYGDPKFRMHLANGLDWALGKK